MNNDYEVRKLPTKTKIIFAVLSILALGIYLLIENTKSRDAQIILLNLGYHNISNFNVYAKTKVEDKVSKIQGDRYFVTFINNETKEDCRGFILKDYKRNLDQDITCKKAK